MTLAWHCLFVLVLFTLNPGAWAQTARDAYPTHEVQIVVPNEPGGGLDAVARQLARGLTTALGQTFNVVNRSGASGNIGTASVARAEPDGHTLLLTGVGHLVSPLLHDKPGYDPLKDFVPVVKIATAPNVLLVHDSLKGLSLAQLLADPRSRAGGAAAAGPAGATGVGATNVQAQAPGNAAGEVRSLAFASAGFGHSSQLAAEVFMGRTGAQWLHVPYRGTSPATRALISGEVQLMFVPAGSVLPLLATGNTHAMAVAHARRMAVLPQVPTLAELGVRGAEFSQWYGLFAPAGTPEAVLERLHRATATFLADAALRQQLQAQGLDLSSLGRPAFARFLDEEAQRLKTVVRREKVEEPTK